MAKPLKYRQHNEHVWAYAHHRIALIRAQAVQAAASEVVKELTHGKV